MDNYYFLSHFPRSGNGDFRSLRFGGMRKCAKCLNSLFYERVESFFFFISEVNAYRFGPSSENAGTENSLPCPLVKVMANNFSLCRRSSNQCSLVFLQTRFYGICFGRKMLRNGSRKEQALLEKKGWKDCRGKTGSGIAWPDPLPTRARSDGYNNTFQVGPQCN